MFRVIGSFRKSRWLIIVAALIVLIVEKSCPMPPKDFGSSVSSRKIDNPINDQRNIDGIKFPEEVVDVNRNFVPVVLPSCEGRTFCEDAPVYPQQHISNIISRMDSLRIFSGVDEIDINQRIGPGDGTEMLCGSETKIVFPKTARNVDQEWLFIVQDEKNGYKQGLQVENCDVGTAEGACKIIEGAILGYKTSCKQKYVSRVMAAVGKNGTVVTEKFSMPSSCCCQIKLISGGDLALRFGGSSAKNQTPVPTERERYV